MVVRTYAALRRAVILKVLCAASADLESEAVMTQLALAAELRISSNPQPCRTCSALQLYL